MMMFAVLFAVFVASAVQAKTPDYCQMESDTGMCRGHFPRFFYNQKTGACEEFVYGGCGGNSNRFHTEEACLKVCKPKTKEEVCVLGPDPGPCRGAFPMFFYNSETEKCEEFVYGGCQGNDNKFDSEEECMGFCKPAAQKGREDHDCDLESDSGPCLAYMPRFYYDQKEGMCKTFIYGGCAGNKNNFKSIEECLNKCGAVSSASICELEKEIGPCKAAVPRFHFNKNSGKCELFIYGGCNGNENNFATQEECEAKCPATHQRAREDHDCHLKGETGPCDAYFPRYYYDQEKGMCIEFVYGGCGGNKNNFKTRDECLNKCGAV